MKMKKRFLSILLSLALVLGLMPGMSMTAYASVSASGNCGATGNESGVTWSLDDSGNLTISGAGAMADYTYPSEVPWNSQVSTIKKVIIENGVTSIGVYAFYDCKALENITIPSSVTSIGKTSFNSCYALTDITIPSSVTSIGDYAFANCKGLSSVTIPESVTVIGKKAFQTCLALESVIFTPGTADTKLEIGAEAFFQTKSGTKVSYGDGDTRLYDGNTEITTNTLLTNIHSTTEDTYKTLKWKVPVTEWESNDCLVKLDGTTLTVSKISGKTTGNMADYTISNTAPWNSIKDGITSVVISDGVTGVGAYAFYNFSYMTSLSIADTVTSIGNCAFRTTSNTSAPINVTIPASVTRIGTDAFYSSVSRNFEFVRPATESTLIVGNTAFHSLAKLNYSGDSKYALCQDDNEIELTGTQNENQKLNGKTLTWKIPTYSITSTAENGTVTATAGSSTTAVTKAEKDTTVTLTIEPASGYQFKSIKATVPKENIEEFSDLVSLMGTAEYTGIYNFAGYTCKVENNKIVVQNGNNELIAEAAASEVTNFSSPYDNCYSFECNGKNWSFEDDTEGKFSIRTSASEDSLFFGSGTYNGTLPFTEFELNTVTPGSKYTFTMPKKNVTVKAEFEESSHEHSFTYSATGEKIVATCSANGCTLTNQQAVLTIVKPTLKTYGQTGEGISEKATLTGLEAFNTATRKTIAVTNIKYVGRDGTTYAESTTAPTNAGKYTAKITVEGKTASVDYEITKADSTATVTAPTAKTLTYTGSAQELVNSGSATGGTMYYAVTAENAAPADESLYTTSIPTATDAGTYYVWYMVKGNSGHSDVAAKSLTVSIAGKDISAAKVTLSNTSFMYDNSEKTVSVKKVTLGDKELAADDYEMSGTIKATDQGDYEVTVTGKGNYTGTVKAKWSIAKKTSEVVLETPSDVTTAVSDVACENLSSYTDSQTEDTVAVKLDVKPVAENSVDNNVASKIKAAIQEAFSGVESESTKTEYLDMKVTKAVNGGTAQEISDVSAVLEIELSYDLTGKYNPVIVREHGGKAMQFGRLSSKPLSGFKDGTFFVGNNSIFVYSRYFSTYSITYATAPTYQVTFDDATGNTNQIIVSSGGKVTRPADPTRSGYTFNGWYNGDKAYDFNSAVNSDIALTAKWTKNGSPGGNGGSGGGGTTPVTPGKNTPAKPSAPTLDSKTDTSITVKTVAGQEYSRDGGKTWQTSGTFTGLTPETEYSIVTKIAATSTANESPVSDALKVTTDKKADSSTPTPGSTTTPTDKPTETPGSTTAPTDTPSTTTTPGATDTPSTTTTPGATSAPADKVTKTEKAKAKLSLNAGLKVSCVGKKVTVKWGKVSKADRYVVYAAYCGPDKCTKIKALSGSKTSMTFTKLNGSKLNLKKNIKVYVIAYRKVNGKETKLAKSITAHVVGTKNAKYTNVKKIKLSKSSYTLKVNKTATVKAEIVLEDKKKKQLSDSHAPEFRYASSNTKVATVDKNGKIKAVGKGTCYIYVYAKNGYAKKIKVTVK